MRTTFLFVVSNGNEEFRFTERNLTRMRTESRVTARTGHDVYAAERSIHAKIFFPY
jgi:hypothetical protein